MPTAVNKIQGDDGDAQLVGQAVFKVSIPRESQLLEWTLLSSLSNQGAEVVVGALFGVGAEDILTGLDLLRGRARRVARDFLLPAF